jgi:aldehyde dehydrogenase (NAD+)
MRDASMNGQQEVEVSPGSPARPHVTVLPPAELAAAFRRQQAHQWTMRRRSAAERVARLKALKRAIVSRRDAILDGLYADLRKNRSEAELAEVQLVLNELNEATARTPEWTAPTEVPTPLHMLGTRSRIQYEPRGVVLILTPSNYPFAMIFAPLVGAVAAGNCVMLRPSEKMPHTTAVAAAIVQAVFPPEEVLLVGGGHSTVGALLDLPFDHIFFTGSPSTGSKIMAAAAARVTSVTLELGGKSPVIVDETADLAHAARSIVWGKFVSAGQNGVAPDYVLVHESRADGFFAACREVLAGFYGATEEERQASDDYCRMIDEASCRRVADLLDAAVRGGARLEAGGRVDPASRYIAPTVLSGVDANSALMQEEIFGPVLPVLTCRSRDEAVAFVQARPRPLALYIFSRDQAGIDEVLNQTSAGGTVVNNCLIHLINPHLPFGGVGASGFGRYHGRFGFETFSHARAVVVQGRPQLSHFFYPPYARLRRGWLGSMLALARRLRD